MQYVKPYATFLLLLMALAFVGCSDAVMDAGPPETQDVESNPKFRNAHLFGEQRAGKLLTRYEDALSATDLVLRAEDTVMSMSRLLTRYEDTEGVTVKRSYDNVFRGIAITVAHERVQAVLDAILADPEIKWVEPDVRMKQIRPTTIDFNVNEGQYLPWGVDYTDAEKVVDLVASTIGNVDLFILDSGISTNKDITVASARNFSSAGSADDNVGHGTHVAGTAAALNNAEGVLGVGAGVRVHNYKVLDDYGQTESSTVIAAVEAITELKLANPSRPMVVNISFGADIGTTSYTALDDAIAASIEAGVFYVIAAGNDGIDASTVTPAHVEGALTVGAHDNRLRMASFSNYGPVVDVFAPGVDIVSLPSQRLPGMELVLMSGTSMAAPHVAGALAVYLSQDPTATLSTVERRLSGFATASLSGMPDGTTDLVLYAGNMVSTKGGGGGGKKK